MRVKRIVVFVLNLLVAVIFQKVVLANESLFYKEINAIGGYSRQEHWIGKSSTLSNSLGFEDYRKFSTEYGDFLTTDLQLRAAYDSTKNSHDAWSLQIHNAWLEYRLGSGKKVRLGHFDVPFGLEPSLDTHGTILQTIAEMNIGSKQDWGLAFKGVGQSFEFETALQIGSGMSVYRRDGSFLASARLGSASNNNFQCGISLLYGRWLDAPGMNTFPRNDLTSDETTLKKRVGFDAQYLFGPFLFKSEVDYGSNNHDAVLGHFWEVDYTLPRHQNWEFELQFQSWINDLRQSNSDDSTLGLGVSYKVNQNVTVRSVYYHDFNRMGGNEDDQFLVQVYYFGL